MKIYKNKPNFSHKWRPPANTNWQPAASTNEFFRTKKGFYEVTRLERQYTGFMCMVGRIGLAAAGIFTLGIPYCFSSYRRLVFDGKRVKRYCLENTFKKKNNLNDFWDKNKKTWLSQFQINAYYSYLGDLHPKLFSPSDIGNCLSIDDIQNNDIQTIIASDVEKARKNNKTLLAYPLLIHNRFFPSWTHWTLVCIDLEQCTVEYYDSTKNFGNHREIVNSLQTVATDLKSSNGQSFSFVPKITKCVQKNTYQCGIWVCLCLEKRLKEPSFDFNNFTENSSATAAAKRDEIQKLFLKRNFRMKDQSSCTWDNRNQGRKTFM